MKMQGYSGSQLWDTAFAVQVRICHERHLSVHDSRCIATPRPPQWRARPSGPQQESWPELILLKRHSMASPVHRLSWRQGSQMTLRSRCSGRIAS